MKKSLRILLELFGPSFFMGIMMAITAWHNYKLHGGPTAPVQTLVDPPHYLIIFINALEVFFIPSVFYTLLMEAAYRHGLRRRSYRCILFSAFFVMLSFIALAVCVALLGSNIHLLLDRETRVLFAVGAGVGLIIGVILHLSEPREGKTLSE